MSNAHPRRDTRRTAGVLFCPRSRRNRSSALGGATDEGIQSGGGVLESSTERSSASATAAKHSRRGKTDYIGGIAKEPGWKKESKKGRRPGSDDVFRTRATQGGE